MIDIFGKQLGIPFVKGLGTSVAIADDATTYISTQTEIYSLYNNKLTKIYKGIDRIKEIYTLSHINIIIILFDDHVELRNIDDIGNKYSDSRINRINHQIQYIYTWNNISSNDSTKSITDTASDLMSLATIFVDNKSIHDGNDNSDGNDNDDNNNNTNNNTNINTNNNNTDDNEITDLITYLVLISKNQIFLLKWINRKFHDQYNLYIPNIRYVQFISVDEIVCIPNTDLSDLIHVNLKTSKIQHNDISKILNLKKTLLYFNTSNQLSNISYFNNQLIFLKHDEFLNVNYQNLDKIINFEKITQTNFKSSLIKFPFIFLIFDNYIEVRSIQNFQLFQTIQLNSIIQVDYYDNYLVVLSKDRLNLLKLLNYDLILDELYNVKDYDNAILLVENLDISNFIDDDDHDDHDDEHDNSSSSASLSPKQIKFIKLRKFKLLKAIHLIKDSSSRENFSQSIDLFTEFLASPNLVISNLSPELKTLIVEGKIEPTDIQNFKINQLISFFADSRRKLIRLLDNKNTVFKFNNLEISLSIYQRDDLNFSVLENLKFLDNYLFDCYLLVNKQMINPFLRVKNYCDFDIVETKCKSLNLIDQLTTFYYTRNEYEKIINILIDSKEIDKLVFFFQRLIQDDPHLINLVLNNLDIIIKTNTEYFEMIFLNDSIDYSNVNYKLIISYLNDNHLNGYLIRYLEYLVFNQNIINMEITNQLFNIYLDDITENFQKIEKLYSIGNYNANQILKKLKNLPKSENSKRLMITPLIKLGRYDDILNIFVYDFDDIKSCVDFCLDVKKIKNDSLSRGLIFKVIDLCLKNKDHSSIINYILNNPDLDFINFEEILIKLPSEISIHLMSSFLVLNLKKLNSLNNDFIIKNELLKVNVINMKLNKMNLERKMHKLTKNSICVKCGRNFNKSEILCFHPNGDILHYSCSKKV